MKEKEIINKMKKHVAGEMKSDKPLRFEPTTWRARVKHDKLKFNDELKAAFLEAYAQDNLISKACEAVGISTGTYAEHVKIDTEFAAAVENAKIVYKDRVLGHAQDLIFNGRNRPIMGGEFKNEIVAHENIMFPTLIAMEMKRVEPEYIERKEIEHKGSIGGVIVAPAGLSCEDWIKQEQEKNKLIDEPTPTGQ